MNRPLNIGECCCLIHSGVCFLARMDASQLRHGANLDIAANPKEVTAAIE